MAVSRPVTGWGSDISSSQKSAFYFCNDGSILHKAGELLNN